jgi:hypothetical protein
MSDESLEKHIQIDGPDMTPNKPSPLFGGGGSGGDGSGGDGGGEIPSVPLHVGPVKQFYRDLIMVLTEPRIFFEVRYPETTFAYALTFGILVNWIAAFLGWLTRVVRHETLLDGFLKMRDRLQELPYWKNIPDNFWAQANPETATNAFPPWAVELFGIIITPFQSLITLIFYGIMIFIGCYMLVPKDSSRDGIELKNTIRIMSFTAAPVLVSAILGFLPFGLGTFFGGIYALVLLVFALSLRFRVSKLRSFGVVILPGILGTAVFSCLIGIFAALGIALFASFFGSGH